MIWAQAALPYSKVHYVRFLRPPFLLIPRPITPNKFALSPKDTISLCVLSFDQKLHTHDYSNVCDVLIKKKITTLFKKYHFFHKFPSEIVTKHILFGIFGKTPFLCKISLLSRRPFCFVIFTSPNAPYFENWGQYTRV